MPFFSQKVANFKSTKACRFSWLTTQIFNQQSIRQNHLSKTFNDTSVFFFLTNIQSFDTSFYLKHFPLEQHVLLQSCRERTFRSSAKHFPSSPYSFRGQSRSDRTGNFQRDHTMLQCIFLLSDSGWDQHLISQALTFHGQNRILIALLFLLNFIDVTLCFTYRL